MTSRRLAVVLAAIATTSLLAACTGTSPDDPASQATDATPTLASDGHAEAETLTVGLTYIPDVQFAPFYAAASLGYYEEADLDVELRHHGASESLFGAIESGQEQLVVASGDEVLAQRAGGGTLTQVATLYSSSPVALIAPEASGATSVADLAGATIGVPGEYGSTYLGLLMLLAEAGMSTDDVEVTSIGYTQTTGLLTGEVDAVMGYRNSDAVRIAEGGMPVTIMTPTDLVSVGIALPQEEYEAHPDTVTAFVEATLRGVAAVIEDPEAAVEIASEYIPGMTEQAKADALTVLTATVPLLSTTGQTDPATWQAMAEAMLAAGMISEIPDGGLAG